MSRKKKKIFITLINSELQLICEVEKFIKVYKSKILPINENDNISIYIDNILIEQTKVNTIC